MRIAWFTPFSKKSAIARYSDVVAAELSKYAAVDLWHSDAVDVRETKLKTVRFPQASQVDLTRLAAYDLIVYNLGNHLPYHREIFKVSRMVPGVCILHDFVMHHFFAAYFLEDVKRPDAYSAAMDRLYGDGGKAAAEAALAGKRKPVWQTDEVVRYPFFEEAIRGAYGVVTHSSFLRQEVEKSYPGPVCNIPLAYNAFTGVPPLTRKDLAIPEENILIVTVGHVNPNKRIHAAIEALANSRGGGANFSFAILGPYDPVYREQLLASVNRHGLRDSVSFLGYAPDEVLQSYLMHADICVNLRFPALEGASASVIEEMLYGKPVIVTDRGFYRELPDDCVVKIDPDREQQELPAALKKLAADRQFREALGARARRFAEANFQPERYAKEFLQFAWEARSWKPLLQLADRMAVELGAMGLHHGMEIVDSVSRQCCDLYCAPEDEDRAT